MKPDEGADLYNGADDFASMQKTTWPGEQHQRSKAETRFPLLSRRWPDDTYELGYQGDSTSPL